MSVSDDEPRQAPAREELPAAWLGTGAFAGGVAAAALAWFFVFRPILTWADENPVLASSFLMAGLVSAVVVVHKRAERTSDAQRRVRKAEAERERARFRETQRSLGLVEYAPPEGPAVWGAPHEVESWKALDAERAIRHARESRLLHLLTTFRPCLWHDHEAPYHAELAGWLRASFPDTQVEVQRGRSRPDILVHDVAVEVKGPTRRAELETIADKCSRYMQHFPRLVVVLFDVQVPEPFYREWETGITLTFPGVTLIRIDPPPVAPKPAMRTMHDAVCSACHVATSVPFAPRPGLPVYCLPCLRAKRPHGRMA